MIEGLRQRLAARRERTTRDFEALAAEFGAWRVTVWMSNVCLLGGIAVGLVFAGDTVAVLHPFSVLDTVFLFAGVIFAVGFFGLYFFTEVGRGYRRIERESRTTKRTTQ